MDEITKCTAPLLEFGRSISTREIGTDNFDTPRQIKSFIGKLNKTGKMPIIIVH